MAMKHLTRRQRDALAFIKNFQIENGYSPSYDEIGAALGLAKSGVHRVVIGLETRGAVRRFPKLARAIEVLR